MMIASFDTNSDGALNETELQAALTGLRDLMQAQQMQNGGMQGGQAAAMQATGGANTQNAASGDAGPGTGGGRGRPQGPVGRK
jgi:hypothetical protein